MKKITFLLLFFCSIISMGQVSSGMEQEFDYGIKNNSTQTITTPPYLTTTGMDGTQGKIPSALIEKTDNKQNSLTVDGAGTKYPTVDAVNGGLTLKVNGTNASDTYRNIYYMGDSLTDNGTFIYAINANLGSAWTSYNFGRSGNTTSQMLSRFNSDIILKEHQSHLVIMGGTNDVTSLIPAITIQANLQSMYTSAHNAGMKVVAVTITPRTTTGSQLAIQNAVNTWIKTTAINVDYIVDPYTTLADPSNPTQLLPSYTTDGLHMTELGYLTLGSYIYNNATWNERIYSAPLRIDVKGLASANQSLNTDSSPTFNTINDITVGHGGGNVYSNTALGRQSLNNNTYGRYNTTVGNQSLFNNTSGHSNIGLGHQVLQFNTTGYANLAAGYQSLNSNISGTNNVGLGISALFSNTTGGSNIAIGSNALRSNITGSGLIAIGSSAMLKTNGATNSVSLGTNTLQNNTTGSNIVAVGTNALVANTTGNGNIGIGYLALGTNIVGGANIGIGQSSLFNTKGSTNVAIGSNSLLNNTTGSDNLALGLNAGSFIADGTTSLAISNTSLFLGGSTKALINNTSNEIVIGYNAIGRGSNTVTLGNTSITSTRLRGSILGGSFVKDSGTNLQALMADGSVKDIGNVDNTSDSNKPVSTAQQTALNLKADLASPALTGTPTAPTATAGTNTTQIATTAFVQAVDANAVHKTGVESISGNKTFNATVSVVNPVNSEQTVIFENGTLKLTTFDLEAQATIDASLLTTSRSHKLPDDSGTIALVETVRPYKVYTALLSQTGTNAPTATVLENTLGGTVVWTRSSTGLYNGTLTGIFTASKTVFFINQGNGASRLSGYRPDTNTVQVVSMNAYLNEFADNSINNASIEIRVYNFVFLLLPYSMIKRRKRKIKQLK